MTIEQLQARLRDAHARIGNDGRFSFTVNQSGTGTECYVTHWFRPTPYAFEDCRTVGTGTATECLKSLDRYVDAYARRPTDEEVGMTLGIVSPADPEQYKIAAE
jgi:hypothetical protein